MEIKLYRKSNIKYSLHDSIINKIEFSDDEIKFRLHCVYTYEEDKEHGYEATVKFTRINYEIDCNIYVFNRDFYCSDEGLFHGGKYTLNSFLNKYSNYEIEIVSEAYSYYSAIYEALLRTDEGYFSLIINIWCDGDIIYDIGEQLF